MVVTIDNFFGVYLLNSVNERHKGACYIGFTVNPERRIKQHNSGKEKGGARKTDKKRPWKMVLITHGFPSKIAALRFEWAWQHPQVSTRLNHLSKRERGEKEFDYRIRILSEMLNTAPWKRLPLTVQWLNQEYNRHLDHEPPKHMPVTYGPVRARLRRHKFDGEAAADDYDTQSSEDEDESDDYDSDECVPLFQRLMQKKQPKKPTTIKNSHHKCYICKEDHSTPAHFFLGCLESTCKMFSHSKCLAHEFLRQEGTERHKLVPVQGKCPACSQVLLWGDLIRKHHGYHQQFQH